MLRASHPQPTTQISLAVDANIWAYRLTKGLSGPKIWRSVLKRLCRLLIEGQKAVFVFDGGKTPLLKMKALRQRQQRRDQAEEKLKLHAARVAIKKYLAGEYVFDGKESAEIVETEESEESEQDRFEDSGSDQDSDNEDPEPLTPSIPFSLSQPIESLLQIKRVLQSFKARNLKKFAPSSSRKKGILARDWTRKYKLIKNSEGIGYSIASEPAEPSEKAQEEAETVASDAFKDFDLFGKVEEEEILMKEVAICSETEEEKQSFLDQVSLEVEESVSFKGESFSNEIQSVNAGEKASVESNSDYIDSYSSLSEQQQDSTDETALESDLIDNSVSKTAKEKGHPIDFTADVPIEVHPIDDSTSTNEFYLVGDSGVISSIATENTCSTDESMSLNQSTEENVPSIDDSVSKNPIEETNSLPFVPPAPPSTKELKKLHSLQRQANNPTEEFTQLFTQLLKIMGIPFLIAEGEAEILCTALESKGIVQGVITDDNDAFLFGAQCIYRNFFSPSSPTAKYLAKEQPLNREQLILSAYFLGCDYSIGVSGIGPQKFIALLDQVQSIDDLHLFYLNNREKYEFPPEFDGKQMYEYYKNAVSALKVPPIPPAAPVNVKELGKFMRLNSDWSIEQTLAFVKPVLEVQAKCDAKRK